MVIALPEIGKTNPEVLAHHILPFLGAKNPAALAGKGIAAWVAGETSTASRGVTVIGADGIDSPLVPPRVDPFRAAFGRTAAENVEASKSM